MGRPRKTPLVTDEEIDFSEQESNESNEPARAKLRPKLTYDKFLEVLAGLKPDIDAPCLYINRIKPKIDCKLSGRKFGYLEKIYQMPTDLRGHIKITHGGGDYQLLLNADNRVPSPVASTVLEIPIAEADPILDPKELVRGGAENEQLIRRWMQEGKVTISPEGDVLPASHPSQAAGQPAGNPLVDRVMQKALDIAFAPPQPDKGLSLADVLALMNANKGPAGGDPMIKFMMDRLAASEERSNKMLDQMFELRTKGGGGAGGLDATLAAIEKLKNITGNDGSGSGGSLVRDLIQAAPSIMGPLVGAFMAFKGVGMPGGGAPAVTAAPGDTATIENQDAARQARIMEELHRFASSVINAIERGKSGDDFAESFIDMAGDQRYQQVASMGEKAILATFYAFPDLVPHLERRKADMEVFLAAFVHAYDPEPGAPGVEEGASVNATA